VKVNTRPGKDGKWYPVTRKPADLARIRGLVHSLHCQQGLSRHKIQKRLLMCHGIRRSIGAISQDLSRFECDKCAPAPVVRSQAFAWR
jgi:hypothetical protein